MNEAHPEPLIDTHAHTHTPRLFSHLSFLLFTHLSFSSLLFSYFPLRPFTSSPLPAPFLLSSSPPLAIPLLFSTFFPHSFSPEIVLSCSFSLVLSASLPFPPLLFFPFHSPHLAEAPHPECCDLFPLFSSKLLQRRRCRVGS